jgi:hypothetical protein
MISTVPRFPSGTWAPGQYHLIALVTGVSMLRRNFRWDRWVMPWWLPAITWAVAVMFALLGAAFAEDCRISLGIGGLLTVAALASIRRQVLRHQRHHRRMDREHGVMAAVVRFTFRHDGRPVPAGLDDEREQRPGVVAFTPRGAAPRHSRVRRRNA